MIPTNCLLTVKNNKPDRWGVDIATSTQIVKCYMNYKTKIMGQEVNSSQPTVESVPEGTILMTGVIPLKLGDSLEWESLHGETLKAKPKDISYIMDTSGKPAYTKVIF